ncbi:hypothetical protein Tco_1420718, partial [Tanacetum coccineum]
DNLKMEMEMEIPSVKASANSDIVYFFTSAQDGDPLQDDVRLCLGDDLKKAQDHNQRQVKDESKDHYPKFVPAIVVVVASAVVVVESAVVVGAGDGIGEGAFSFSCSVIGNKLDSLNVFTFKLVVVSTNETF